MSNEKPPVLSNGRLLVLLGTTEFTERQGREAQRDADAAYYEPLIEQAKAEVFEEIESRIKEALEAPTHEANDYNCEDWPIGQGCSGCKGDELREDTIKWLASCKSKYGGKK